MFKISASVGRGGANRAADVNLVQKALNLLPASRGGPQVPLIEDSLVGEKTVGAISRFQQWAFGWADGRIDAAAQTIGKLVEELKEVSRLTETLRPILRAQVARLGVGGLGPDAVLDQLTLLSPFRLAVLAVALAEMVPAPEGAVNDRSSGEPSARIPNSNKEVIDPRFGWRRLKEYIDLGYPELKTKMSSEKYHRGIMERGAQIEVSASGELSWCGIFCAWVYRQRERLVPFLPPGKSLRDVVWTPQKLGMPTSKPTWQEGAWTNEIKPGDICAQPKSMNNHHFLVLCRAGNGNLWTINSNSTNHANVVKQWHISTVQGWYSANDYLVGPGG